MKAITANGIIKKIAINNVLNAVAEEKSRILLTMATGTGKNRCCLPNSLETFSNPLDFKTRRLRRPRILFLADRNILADQAYNTFTPFPQDALVRINPLDIRKKGGVPTSGSIFSLFSKTFMSGQNNTHYFGDYPKIFLILLLLTKSSRWSERESNWRGILDYFLPPFN